MLLEPAWRSSPAFSPSVSSSYLLAGLGISTARATSKPTEISLHDRVAHARDDRAGDVASRAASAAGLGATLVQMFLQSVRRDARQQPHDRGAPLRSTALLLIVVPVTRARPGRSATSQHPHRRPLDGRPEHRGAVSQIGAAVPETRMPASPGAIDTVSRPGRPISTLTTRTSPGR